MPKPQTKPVTFKVPVDVWARIKTLSEISGLRVEAIVKQALVMRLEAEVKR